MARNRFGDVIAGIQGRTVQRFHQPNLVFVDHGGVEKPDCKETRFIIRTAGSE